MRGRLVPVVVGLTLVGCGTGDSTRSAGPVAVPAAVTVDSAANGTRVALAVGQRLIVSLPAEPTTGFLWQIRELDRAIVVQNDDPDFRPDSRADATVGVGGSSVWTFTAAAPGTTPLSMGYQRPWEAGSDPDQTFGVTVVVGR
ncbi:protease inhibitor I42 family protein [Nocardia sp. NPDC004068]|uniref:protease inhibitor I42 family protein n=1 Tax=Nocardia sp. NPDC004068 TaxID=3364303 RepID=UPI0036B4F76F